MLRCRRLGRKPGLAPNASAQIIRKIKQNSCTHFFYMPLRLPEPALFEVAEISLLKSAFGADIFGLM